MTSRQDPVVVRLRALGTFAAATEQEIARIASTGRGYTLPARWSMIWERTPADKAYVVLDGEVDVHRDGKVVARLGAGDVIGEVAIVRHRLRSATVVAATALDVLAFTRDEVEQLYAEVPAFREALDRAVDDHVA